MRTEKKSQARALLTRNKLLEVAIDAFATSGYEGVGTREIADRAGANISAIRYHFGDKKGLYEAVIRHISEGIRERVSPFIDQVRARAEASGTSKEELIELLCRLITSFASQLLASGVPDSWARLVTREQVAPTDAFPIMYNVFRLLIEATTLVLSRMTGEKPEAERVRISAMTIIGQTLVFRTHRATAMKFIGWKSLGEREVSALQSVVSDHCRAIMLSRSEPVR